MQLYFTTTINGLSNFPDEIDKAVAASKHEWIENGGKGGFNEKQEEDLDKGKATCSSG